MRCLKTLLLTPKDANVYCLIDCGPGNACGNVICQLLTVSQVFEIPFRLLIATNNGSRIDLGIQSQFVLFRLASKEAASSIEQDLGTW